MKIQSSRGPEPAIFIRTQHRNVRVAYSAILYIQASRNYTIVHLKDAGHWTLTGLAQWEGWLPKELFCRVHRSYIVALDKIEAFDKQMIDIGDEQLPIGDEYRARLETAVTILDTRGAAARIFATLANEPL